MTNDEYMRWLATLQSGDEVAVEGPRDRDGLSHVFVDRIDYADARRILVATCERAFPRDRKENGAGYSLRPVTSEMKCEFKRQQLWRLLRRYGDYDKFVALVPMATVLKMLAVLDNRGEDNSQDAKEESHEPNQ